MIAGVLGEGTIDPKTPLANPLYADFTGFPRLYVTAGGVESLVDNATRLAEKAQAAGVDVTLSVVEGSSTSSRSWPATHPRPTTEIAAIAKWYRG